MGEQSYRNGHPAVQPRPQTLQLVYQILVMPATSADEMRVIEFMQDNLPETGAPNRSGFMSGCFCTRVIPGTPLSARIFSDAGTIFTEMGRPVPGRTPDDPRWKLGIISKGLHNLLNAHFRPANFKQFEIA